MFNSLSGIVEQLQHVIDAARRRRRRAIVQIKCNTGMNRVGVDNVDDLKEVIAMARGSADAVELRGVYTHFACADDDDLSVTHKQRSVFDNFLSHLNDDSVIHCSNSAGTLMLGSADCDTVRIGIALYGLQPTPERVMTRDTPIAPALSWYSTVTQVRCVREIGSGVSYSHTYRTQRANEWLATVAVGYADGFRRVDGNAVVIAGHLCPVVGRVTMDQVVVRLPDSIARSVRAGDLVELIGMKRTTGDVAASWKTIDYDVVCSIGKRVQRYFTLD